jgi:hypothetical protein
MTGGLRGKAPSTPGSKVSANQSARKERLAEELRANLKRRKAAARRHKDAETDDSEASSSDGEDA